MHSTDINEYPSKIMMRKYTRHINLMLYHLYADRIIVAALQKGFPAEYKKKITNDETLGEKKN